MKQYIRNGRYSFVEYRIRNNLKCCRSFRYGSHITVPLDPDSINFVVVSGGGGGGDGAGSGSDRSAW